MLSFVEFFEGTHRTKTQAARIIDETFHKLMLSTSDLDRQMPATSYADADLLIMRMNKSKPTIASLIAEEGEIPIQRNRVELSSERLGELKVGKQILWKANDFKMLRKLGMSDVPQQVRQEIERTIFQVGADMVPSLYEKATMLAIKIATTGQCIFTDPLTGIEVELSYSDLTDAALMPAALTGNARWDQPATANALTNLETHARAFYDKFGYYLPEITMRDHSLQDMKAQTSVRRALLARRGATQIDAEVIADLYLEDAEVIDLIKQRTKCTTVTIVDSMYSEEQADGTVVDKYFLDDDTYYFSEPRFIERAFVPTVEKNFAPGIYTRTREINDAPRVERTVAVGAFVPFAADARKLAARKVA
jgi:hypothetical protein